MKYKLLIAYDGTHYVGWQIQPIGQSIQGSIEATLTQLLGTPHRLIGASRTDAGVHARGQVAHLTTLQTLNTAELQFKLNRLLPKDIRICHLIQVTDDFHAQQSALSKVYHYHLWLDPIVDPFLHNYCLHIRRPLNLEAMKRAAKEFVGFRDFTSFANVGAEVKTGWRTLLRIDFVEQVGGLRLEFEGTGFLYKMVRNIVGTLLKVGYNQLNENQIPTLFEARDRRYAPAPAPAHALFLMSVKFSENHNAVNDVK